ncbi:MAG: hypothetical protein GY772_22135, partial [bacterium]|nr:hypothetical protein [bacterium]
MLAEPDVYGGNDDGSQWMPSALARYARRPTGPDAAVRLPVEGASSSTGTPRTMLWDDVTLFDYLAGAMPQKYQPRSRAGVVGFRTIHPDNEPEAYYYAKLLLHMPWRRLADWLLPGDNGSHQRACERILAEQATFLRSTCYPNTDFGIDVARDLARLQAGIMAMHGTEEGDAAQERLEGHYRILHALRQRIDGEGR